MRTLALRLALVCSFWLLAAPLSGQGEQAPVQDPPPQQQQLDETTREALQRLAVALRQKRNALEQAQQQNDRETAGALEGEIAALRYQFAGLAAHLDVQNFEIPKQSKFDLNEEIEQLLRPLVRALKDATAGPREVGELRDRLDFVSDRLQTAKQAADAVLQTRDALPEDSVERAEAEREYAEHWRPRLDRLEREQLVLQANLKLLEDGQDSVVSGVSNSVRSFLETSGLSLVLCALVFLVTYFGLGLLSKPLLRKRRQRGFSARLAEVLLRIIITIVAIAATLMVPYTRNDLLLLAIGIVFLVGAGWVIVKMAPHLFEQVRLILNIGPVREGERLLVDGLPYRIDALRFYSKLSNPDLSGGLLRVPIKDLIGERSRPLGHDEPWFPSKEGDVVALEDGTVGQVQLQTPEVVVVVERHDAPRSYPTLAFLEQNPRNLSHGFEIVVTFGVDYSLQPDIDAKVPDALQKKVAAGLGDLIEEHELRSVCVELESAGESSLNFAVLVELEGTAAIHYHELHRRVNTLLVRACTENGFGIPFPQLTVHKS